MSLLDEIQAKCPPQLIASAEHGAIAALVSVGRTRLQKTTIGKGTVLATLGIATGNAFLDVVDGAPDYRHAKSVLASGELDLADPTTRGAVNAMVGASVLTQAEADTLLALATQPAPVSVGDVIDALKGV